MAYSLLPLINLQCLRHWSVEGRNACACMSWYRDRSCMTRRKTDVIISQVCSFMHIRPPRTGSLTLMHQGPAAGRLPTSGTCSFFFRICLRVYVCVFVSVLKTPSGRKGWGHLVGSHWRLACTTKPGWWDLSCTSVHKVLNQNRRIFEVFTQFLHT